MHVVIRTDASPSIGGGHVMRCLALADQLVRRGHEITFLVAPGTEATAPSLSARKFSLDEIAPNATPAETAARIRGLGAHVALLDHYGLGIDIEMAIRGVAPLAVIDDAPTRKHDCDLLIDPTLGREEGEYAALLPPGATVSTGSEYAPLRAEFREARTKALHRQRSGLAERVFLSFGASDPRALTLPTARELVRVLRDCILDIVIGPTAQSQAALVQLCAERPHVSLWVDPPGIADIMARADIAVGAAGTMSWERCCLGLPSVAVPIVANQLNVAVVLSRSGAASVPSVSLDVAPHQLAGEAAALISDRSRRLEMSVRAANICDGLGAQRVSLLLERLSRGGHAGLRDDHLKLRTAVESDSQRIWGWRNDPETRAASRSTEFVPWSAHSAWFARVMADPKVMLLVGERTTTGEPVGVVRFDERPDGTLRVNINMAPEARGGGKGSELLALGCRRITELRGPRVLVAEIRCENSASRAIFERCRFELTARDKEFLEYRLATGSTMRKIGGRLSELEGRENPGR
jgi:UDP-2,4-diacetamido-2,4,6-trideoxy-beta-L-altropyranose hydrolase